MSTLEEKTAELLTGLRHFAKKEEAATGCMLGRVTAVGSGTLQVVCNGLVLNRGDLWVSSHLCWMENDGGPNTLRVGDRVILYTPDGDTYHLMSKVVMA